MDQFKQLSVPACDYPHKRKKRGKIYGNWEKANEYFERALDENPEDAKAYVGKVLVGLRLSAVEQINDHLVKLEGDKDFERAIRFSVGADKAQLESVKENADRKWHVLCCRFYPKAGANCRKRKTD